MAEVGVVKAGARTKELVKQLNKNEIAVIMHDDIDVLSAVSLINTGVKTILNTGNSMTDRADSKGTRLLLNNGIRLYDVSLPFEQFKNYDNVVVSGSSLFINGKLFRKCCTKVNSEYLRRNSLLSKENRKEVLYSFIRNTLEHAAGDLDSILNFSSYPEVESCFNNRHAVVVSRNSNTLNELNMIRSYIKDQHPVLIGVDGGADMLLSAGYLPDILIGDMDSISDIGILKSREIILHTYADGTNPNWERLAGLRDGFKTMSLKGTSEDIALMLAYIKGAELITLVGGHSSMEDFMSKGRKGMGSTVITRLIISEKLLDIKNITRAESISL